MFYCSNAELDLKKHFEETYARSGHWVMQAIERQVCSCDFGGSSWTSQEQADDQIRLLGLGSQSTLIDLGSGTGWLGLYMAKQSGCQVTLVDLPENALELAQQRAAEEGLSVQTFTQVADAADLPWPVENFDAVSHSDLLCCLVHKREVLQQCRRIIRPKGRMVFTVISISPGLSTVVYARALSNAPEFTETEKDYPQLLSETGWLIEDRLDPTEAYENSCIRQLEIDISLKSELSDLIGTKEATERISG